MKLVRTITAFLAIPAVAAGAWALLMSFLDFAATSGSKYTAFWIGIFCYIVFQIAFYKPLRTYVFGHELSHALAGVLSGARIKKFKVGKESGSVTLTKDNLWITLAPYIFPIYTFAIILVYVLLGWFCDIKPFYAIFLFFAGFSIAFHIALTIYILGIEQPDLKVYGVFFSYVVIAAVNIITFALLMTFAFAEAISPSQLFGSIITSIINSYKFLFSGVSQIWLAFQKTN
ncbi:hypothetical protein [Endomicrobium proavitum]|uniref:Uncharacterized protein n=1 Tax=Endomicrobium proavitum TaxID=1408281 RepID=A0A0G3WHQ5_9BACT|nr:hypothetical protein [Endomicrobium proavitum]AKL97427.1 conserved membrane protein of unknown function [Endomicrobium proavitum]